jgi:hypothetical protein
MDYMKKYWVLVEDQGDLMFAIREDGTVEYGPRYSSERTVAAFERQFGPCSFIVVPVDNHGPAIEGTEIAVITSITEDEKGPRC